MEWQVCTFNQLDSYTLYSMLQLRVDVFVVEQNCAYPELDNKDLHPQTRHILLKKGDKILAYARVLAPGVSYENSPALGRICVSQTARRLALGRGLMDKALQVASSCWPDLEIRISAQCYLQRFYESFDFIACSEPYLEDDIPHLEMVRAVQSSGGAAV